MNIQNISTHRHFNECFKLIDLGSLYVVDMFSPYIHTVLRMYPYNNIFGFSGDGKMKLLYPFDINMFDRNVMILSYFPLRWDRLMFFIVDLSKEIDWLKTYKNEIYYIIKTIKDEFKF